MTSSDFYCSTTPRVQMCGWIKIPELGNYSRTHCICRNESVHEAVCSVEMACVLCRLICCTGTHGLFVDSELAACHLIIMIYCTVYVVRISHQKQSWVY